MAGGLDPDDNGREREKGNQHAGRVNQAHRPDVARFTLGFADEPENLQRDDRQHARHQVQNQPADKGVDQHLPERLRGRSRRSRVADGQFDLVAEAVVDDHHAADLRRPVAGEFFHELANFKFSFGIGNHFCRSLNLKVVAGVGEKICAGDGLP